MIDHLLINILILPCHFPFLFCNIEYLFDITWQLWALIVRLWVRQRLLWRDLRDFGLFCALLYLTCVNFLYRIRIHDLVVVRCRFWLVWRACFNKRVVLGRSKRVATYLVINHIVTLLHFSIAFLRCNLRSKSCVFLDDFFCIFCRGLGRYMGLVFEVWEYFLQTQQ